MNLIERLREEAQDDPDSLYWKAAECIAALEDDLRTTNAALRLLGADLAKAEARLDAMEQSYKEGITYGYYKATLEDKK